jgi:hypothetical protein
VKRANATSRLCLQSIAATRPRGRLILQKPQAVIIISTRFRTDEFSKTPMTEIFREADEETRGNPIRLSCLFAFLVTTN